MRLLLLGAPGSGKGTQGQRLADALAVRHIASGDLLRAEVDAKTVLGEQVTHYLHAGELVPDAVLLDLTMPLVLEAAMAGGYVLDGFPRSVSQVSAFDERAMNSQAGIECTVFLDAPTEALVPRLLRRAAEQGRSDDTEAVIRNRLQVFEDETRPLVDFYTDRGVLVTIDATASPDEVTAAILAGVGDLLEH